jgi:hypothetical protein
MKLDDRLYSLTERELRYLKNSWAEGFANIVFPAINEERFAVLYSDNPASRSNTPINVIIGALILKEINGDTDEELIGEMMLNYGYQYALHTSSYREQPVSDRTFGRFREKVRKYEEKTGRDLIKEEMTALADVYAKYMAISPGVKRMDSAMVASSCRRLSRLSLMYRTVRDMVEGVKEAGREELLEEKHRRYMKDGEHEDIGYRLKKEDVQAKMEEILADALTLEDVCLDEFEGTDEYRRLKRMIGDQSKETEEGTELKENGEIEPTSMQNPSDEDATYRSKAGKGHVGYVVNLVEACGESGNIVTDYDMRTNTHSDVEFAREVLEALPDKGGAEQDEGIRNVIITDGAYASAELLETAERKGVTLAATTLTGGIEDDFEANFEIDETSHTIKRCPAGHEPKDSKYSEEKGHRAHFDKETCANCPHCDRCPGIFQKRTALIRFTDKARIRAEYYRKTQTDEYKQYARKRNGVEGIPSVLRRRYNIDRMPVRGLVRSKIWMGFKIGALNTVRVLRYAEQMAAALLYYLFSPIFSNIYRLFKNIHSFAYDVTAFEMGF